ncbi:hypothetical protein BC831DRAFT_460162 [Entophlyctis helioformis]|nr:hypothetical protein BC831DRAFT_460162 [Entophlyctis helioformis]
MLAPSWADLDEQWRGLRESRVHAQAHSTGRPHLGSLGSMGSKGSYTDSNSVFDSLRGHAERAAATRAVAQATTSATDMDESSGAASASHLASAGQLLVPPLTPSRQYQQEQPNHRLTPDATGTVVVRTNTSSSGGKWSRDTVELTDLFAPLSLERMFKPLAADPSAGHEQQQQQQRPRSTVLAQVFDSSHRPSASVLDSRSASGSGSASAPSSAPASAPAVGPGARAAPNLLPVSGMALETTQPAVSRPSDLSETEHAPPRFSNKLFSSTHDTWTRGRLSDLMSALEPDSRQESPATSTVLPLASSGPRSAAASAPLPAIRSEKHMDVFRLAPTAGSVREPQTAPLSDPEHSAHLLARSTAPAADPVQGYSQLYPDDIDFLDDLEETEVAAPVLALSTWSKWPPGQRASQQQQQQQQEAAQENNAGNLRSSRQISLHQAALNESDQQSHMRVSVSTSMSASSGSRSASDLQLAQSLARRQAFGSDVSLCGQALSSLKNIAGVQAKPRRLNLSNNQITFLMDVASTTEVLYLARNRLSGLTVLRELDVSFNQITDIRPLMRLPNLCALHAAHNAISSIDFQSSDLNRLHTLVLPYNRIKQLKYFHRLLNLQAVNLECNLLRNLVLSRPLLKLRTLNLSHNRLLAFSGSSFPSLIRLELDGNRLLEIDDPEDLHSLEMLSLEAQEETETATVDFDQGAGYGNGRDHEDSSAQQLVIPALETIREIRVQHLEVIECRDAHVEAIPRSLSMTASGLLRVVLCGNRLRDLSPLAGLEFLQELDVSRNLVGDIRRVLPTMRHLGSLRILDLRHNPITEQFYLNAAGTGQMNGEVDNARHVREICYRSAIISAIGKTLEQFDGQGVSREDRHQARRRMTTLKDFLRGQPHTPVHQHPSASSDARLAAGAQPRQMQQASDDDAVQPDLSLSVMVDPRFAGWKIESFPLGDVTADDRLFVEVAEPDMAGQ